MLVYRSSLFPKVFGQKASQSRMSRLLTLPCAQRVPVPSRVSGLRAGVVQAAHNPLSSRSGTTLCLLLPASIVIVSCYLSAFALPSGAKELPGNEAGEQSRIYLSQEAIICDRNACPPADPSYKPECDWTSSTDGYYAGLTTPSAASTAGYLPGVRSYPICWLEILQQLRHTTPVPIMQHTKSRKELLSQLRHCAKALDAGQSRHILGYVSSSQLRSGCWAFAEALFFANLVLL